MWRYDDFSPGETSEEVDVLVHSTDLAQWRQIYGTSSGGSSIPAGLQVAILMKAYLKAFQPRPPGNIHARQMIRFGDLKAAVGDSLQARISCQRKEIKKDRRWITFEIVLRSSSAVCLIGEVSSIWAA
jgi:hypothetical protein